VSLSIATQRGSLPIAWQLYVPKEWIEDRERARRAGIPDDLAFKTKPEIALTQLREAIASGVAPGIVLADAGYGDETAFREGVTELGLLYAVGIRPGTSVWAPGTAPLPPRPWSRRG
ncbi:transposase, partial [Paraburkholderia sp. BR10923]|uniref:transposase n=1 Tax=Paraburkholderia sp. BR10923 TaxID=3236992 RepID=UPI0034CEC912